jgi:hypothetical protein
VVAGIAGLPQSGQAAARLGVLSLDMSPRYGERRVPAQDDLRPDAAGERGEPVLPRRQQHYHSGRGDDGARAGAGGPFGAAEQGAGGGAGGIVTQPLRQRGARARADDLEETEAVHRGPLEQAGWSELIEEAMSGEIAFPGGGLRLSLTPAMTLFDVDGTLPLPELACAGAAASARTIRRMAIGGSIGIDLPTLAAKADRQAAAAAFDAALPTPFERTAVNGFGFLQIVRPRPRTSLPERLRDDPVGAAARALLRRAERTSGSGPRTIVAAPAVVALLAARQDWRATLARRVGAEIVLRGDSALAISRGHVQAQHP